MKIAIVFDGPPEHFSGRFVEVENEAGESINAGTWEEMPNGWWRLWIDDSAAVAAAEQRGREKCHNWRLHTVELAKLLDAEGTAAHKVGVEQGQCDALAKLEQRLHGKGTCTCTRCGITRDNIAAIKGDDAP
jgi:hypothetical protein